MKKTQILSIFIIFTIILFSSCSKYDENNGISLKSSKARLSKTWKIKTIYGTQNQVIPIKDFIDLMSEKELNYYGITPYFKFTFEKNQEMDFIIGAGFVTIHNPGIWKFIDNEEMIEIDVQENTFYGIPVINEEYKILRLTNSDLWMEYKKNNETYEILLKSK